jgi:hypothetical protein
MAKEPTGALSDRPIQEKIAFLSIWQTGDWRSFLQFLGIPAVQTEGSAQLKAELTGLGMEIKRPDRVCR